MAKKVFVAVRVWHGVDIEVKVFESIDSAKTWIKTWKKSNYYKEDYDTADVVECEIIPAKKITSG